MWQLFAAAGRRARLLAVHTNLHLRLHGHFSALKEWRAVVVFYSYNDNHQL